MFGIILVTDFIEIEFLNSVSEKFWVFIRIWIVIVSIFQQ